MLGLIHIVDDDELVRLSTADVIAHAGYAVCLYSSGDDFLARADLTTPAGLILDLHMPGSSGLEVLARLRELGSPLRVVMLTGVGQVPDAVAAMRGGARDFLQKPWRSDELLQVVAAAMADADEPMVEMPAPAADPLAMLTRRQREVLEALAKGRSNREVGEALGLSIRTVEMHRGDAMRRLGVDNFAEALRLVFDARTRAQPVAA